MPYAAMVLTVRKSHSTISIVPALAKNARTGHPQFWNKESKSEQNGRPARRRMMRSLMTNQHEAQFHRLGRILLLLFFGGVPLVCNRLPVGKSIRLGCLCCLVAHA